MSIEGYQKKKNPETPYYFVTIFPPSHDYVIDWTNMFS